MNRPYSGRFVSRPRDAQDAVHVVGHHDARVKLQLPVAPSQMAPIQNDGFSVAIQFHFPFDDGSEQEFLPRCADGHEISARDRIIEAR
jgi:hypothetical protein